MFSFECFQAYFELVFRCVWSFCPGMFGACVQVCIGLVSRCVWSLCPGVWSLCPGVYGATTADQHVRVAARSDMRVLTFCCQ